MKKNLKPLYIGILVILFGFIGGTIAYFSTNNTFENVFNTSNYVIETSEVFESPNNWTPGTNTPKDITVTNTGDVDAAVRVWFEESWVDKNGNPLPLKDELNTQSVYRRYAYNYNLYWLGLCNNNNVYDMENTNFFYYYKALRPGESTRQLLESVQFNPYFKLNSSMSCTENNDEYSNTQICTSNLDDYSGGKYTLTAHIETVQLSEAENVWGHPIVNHLIEELGDDYYSECAPMNLRSVNYMNNTLALNTNSYEYIFGKKMSRENFESITIVNNMNMPNNVIESWDASENRDKSIKAWYTDTNNNGKYELFIGANGKVRANPNSLTAFENFINVSYLDVRNLDTSQVVNMRSMFESVGRDASGITYLGIEDLDTSNVKYMDHMFSNAGGNWQTIDFSNWDVSNVLSRCDMFSGCRFSQTGIDDWDLDLGLNGRCTHLG